MKPKNVLLTGLLGLLFLTACGQKGGLYLPEEPAPATQTEDAEAAAEANTDERERDGA